MRLGWGGDEGRFFFSCPGRARHECGEPGPILLCMGLFSRFCVQALRCTAEETLRRVQDTRSLVLRAYGESIQLQPIMLWNCKWQGRHQPRPPAAVHTRCEPLALR